MAIKIQHCVRTLRLKVKRESYAWLNGAAEPSLTYSQCEAGFSALKAAA
jgi:hypothetical protein